MAFTRQSLPTRTHAQLPLEGLARQTLVRETGVRIRVLGLWAQGPMLYCGRDQHDDRIQNADVRCQLGVGEFDPRLAESTSNAFFAPAANVRAPRLATLDFPCLSMSDGTHGGAALNPVIAAKGATTPRPALHKPR